jgi:hypothetical protein
MPVKSVAEARYLGIHHPEILHKWKNEGVQTSTKGLPYKVGGGKPKKKPLGAMFGGK